MSHEITPGAWKTKVGNATAKSVLALLGDQVNAEGSGWPSVRYIADRVEVSQRTVQRVIQVFEDIGLLERVERRSNTGRRLNDTLQLSVAKLGEDLRKEYAAALLKAQSKKHFHSVSSDAGECVSSDADGCLQRREEASPATFPPHPLIGGTVPEPLETHTPQPPQAGARALSAQTFMFPDEGKSKTLENGIDQVMQGCGFANRRLRNTLRAVLLQESDKGQPIPTSALAMIDAWKRYTSQGIRLRAKWGAAVFFGDGYWRDSQSWMWNTDELKNERMQSEARVGTYAG